jgi:hypothetical protein
MRLDRRHTKEDQLASLCHLRGVPDCFSEPRLVLDRVVGRYDGQNGARLMLFQEDSCDSGGHRSVAGEGLEQDRAQCDSGRSPSSLTRKRWSLLQRMSGAENSAPACNRLSVEPRKVGASPPKKRTNCFANIARESGHKRVPDFLARTTGTTVRRPLPNASLRRLSRDARAKHHKPAAQASVVGATRGRDQNGGRSAEGWVHGRLGSWWRWMAPGSLGPT